MSDLASKVVKKHKEAVQETIDTVARSLEERSIRISQTAWEKPWTPKEPRGYQVSFRDGLWTDFDTLDAAATFARGLATQIDKAIILLEF